MRSVHKVRRFAWDDIRAVLGIEKECFPKAPFDEVIFMDWYERCPEGFLVAEASGKVIGYIICSSDGYIASIAVVKEERRKGIGGTLIDQVAKRLNLKEMRLHCRVGNTAAQDFFKSYGFREVGRLKGVYEDGEDAIEMVRENW